MSSGYRYLAERTALLMLALLLAGLAIDAGLTIGKDFEERQREVARGRSIGVDLPDGEKLLVWTAPENGCISWDYKDDDGGVTVTENRCSDEWVDSMDMLLLGTVYGGCDCKVESSRQLILTEETHEMLHRTQTRALKSTVLYAALSLTLVYVLIVYKESTPEENARP